MNRNVARVIRLLGALFFAATIASAQVLSTPHLKGTWKGNASKTVCGNAAGSAPVELVLEDHGYKPAGSEAPAGNVSGTLAVGGSGEGVIVARYQAPTLKADVLSMQAPAIYGNPKNPFANYYFEFTAKDPTAGVGYYQTLSGTLSRQNSSCMNLGAQGEVLKVDLKKE